ncbi:MAG: MerC domain-containing protein [Bacteroidota bacterium]
MILSQLTQSKRNSDLFGAIASFLCLIHCLATPFLFVAQAGVATHHEGSPAWWGLIDITLLFVSLAAVYWTVQKTTKQWVKMALSLSWILLALIILNEKFEIYHIAEAWIYAPTLSLVVLHLYNRKYCQCEDETCCTTTEENTI